MSEILASDYPVLRQKILDQIEHDTNGGCWLWTGTSAPSMKDPKRAYICFKRKTHIASRIAFWAFNETNPKNGFVCHKCDMPMCVNPNHLYLGNAMTNVRDMLERGRAIHQKNPDLLRKVGISNGKNNTWSRGAKNQNARLSEQDVIAIYLSPEPTKVLRERYGMSRVQIQKIRKGFAWRHLTQTLVRTNDEERLRLARSRALTRIRAAKGGE